MANLTTDWLGLQLKNPLVLAASPVSKDIEFTAAAVEAGAAAVIMHSLFEEQLIHEQMGAHYFIDTRLDLDAEARSLMPESDLFPVDGEHYIYMLKKIKQRVRVPVIASLNGATPGGWTSYAAKLQEAGADALELNLYDVITSKDISSALVEERQIAIIESVVKQLQIPVTVKLSPFYSSLPGFVAKVEKTGAAGIAVFNRFFQPDISPDELNVDRTLHLSSSQELPLRLHALALLSTQTNLSLACTGGIHSGMDAAKAVLAGAHALQVASAVLQRGPQAVRDILHELDLWLDKMNYAHVADARGVLNLHSAPDPHAWERLNYAKMLAGWQLRKVF